MNNGSPKGVGVEVGDINVLKDTDIGVLRSKRSKDRSTYKKTTKPDGTIVEETKIRRSNNNGGLVSLDTQGVGIGNKSGKTAEVYVSENSTEDAVGFVDSIWGSRQAAGKIQDRRMMEAQAKAGVKPTQSAPAQSAPTQAMPDMTALANFKQQRQGQLSEDHMVRELAAQQQMGLPAPDQSMGRAM